MATYAYIGTGGVQMGGCAVMASTVNIVSDFVARETVYVKAKAEKGILEKVTIKKVIVDNR